MKKVKLNYMHNIYLAMNYNIYKFNKKHMYIPNKINLFNILKQKYYHMLIQYKHLIVLRIYKE